MRAPASRDRAFFRALRKFSRESAAAVQAMPRRAHAGLVEINHREARASFSSFDGLASLDHPEKAGTGKGKRVREGRTLDMAKRGRDLCHIDGG